jgi:hypothetical protein
MIEINCHTFFFYVVILTPHTTGEPSEIHVLSPLCDPPDQIGVKTAFAEQKICFSKRRCVVQLTYNETLCNSTYNKDMIFNSYVCRRDKVDK